MAPPGDDALVGRVLNGRYLIDQRIARGGMATVYRATDQRLDRTVAVKVMHRNMGDEVDFLERFTREAKAAARLNHRGVVSDYDQGSDHDATYLVMEYIPGHTLRDVLRAEAPLSPDRSLGVLADVLVALAAHRPKGSREYRAAKLAIVRACAGARRFSRDGGRLRRTGTMP